MGYRAKRTVSLNQVQDFLLDPFTYNYLNSTFQHTGEEPKSYEGEYSTDVLAWKAYQLLDHAVQAENPFFLTLAPIAPHANVEMNGSALDEGHTVKFGTPVSAKRHEHLFKDLKVPRAASFNPDKVLLPSPNANKAWSPSNP